MPAKVEPWMRELMQSIADEYFSECAFAEDDEAHVADATRRLAEAYAAHAKAEGELRELLDTIEQAWGVIANAYGGDWALATEKWQASAARFRDEYHALLGKYNERLRAAIARELNA